MDKITTIALQRLVIFKDLNIETINLLTEKANLVDMEKGKTIFIDKDEVKQIYIVVTGKVSLYKISESGQKKVIFILDQGSLINEVILDDLSASINCEAFEKGKLLVFAKNDFLDIMKQDFELTKNVLNSFAIKVRRLYRQMKNTTTLNMEKKLAAKLWKLSKDYGQEVEEGVVINLKITITYLADMFGCARETTSRALKKLEDSGLIITKGRKIIIPDRSELAKYFKSCD
ncbi:transcriptional regulator, Crp/Fnr family [Desulfonispora thiosulfatigenes DSM 11270]|uniref:Transcriptional regulator, Crp/Fnr family n=1 Tax=Desulfonispora thiosulfatigenes DSM 11270 TaxID=656914 RepID=A0A1W1VAV9_DESTI|nr:Crp/Fnr family transcriptional regulator [Desulfonispora thiosulfatigenes]SMB90330.1 transcriptional regulator, Crp/Fnr family [Desulfonispora thiosulfatigenes DSM 11270]